MSHIKVASSVLIFLKVVLLFSTRPSSESSEVMTTRLSTCALSTGSTYGEQYSTESLLPLIVSQTMFTFIVMSSRFTFCFLQSRA
jgi:hypothetical protein